MSVSFSESKRSEKRTTDTAKRQFLQTLPDVRGLIKRRRKIQNERKLSQLLPKLSFEGWSYFSSFTEWGYTFVVFLPSSSRGRPEFMVKVFRAGREIQDFRVPMMYDPIYGPDGADVAELERTSAEVLHQLSWRNRVRSFCKRLLGNRTESTPRKRVGD